MIKMKHVEILTFLLFALIIAISSKDYEDYKLVQIIPKTKKHINLLLEWESNSEFDIWNSVKNVDHNVDVLLSPEAFERYKILFTQYNMPYVVTNDNIQQELDKEARELAINRMNGKVVDTYPRYDDLQNWMEATAASNSFVSLYNAGTTEQGRNLTVLVIKNGSPSLRIWFDCGIHAREWISVSTCVSLIDRLIKDFSSAVPAVVSLLRAFEIHFLPLLNPDGYEYTHTVDRFWRKNRKHNPGSTCLGVDLNRNFPYKWMTGGSSNDPCTETFAGGSASSELETQAVINAIQKYTGWSAFFTLHSYGNYFLSPWGYATGIPPHYTEHINTGILYGNAAKAVYGELFSMGTITQLLYVASGSSIDWAYGTLGIKHSYTIELRPRDGIGNLGFVLDQSFIPKVGAETYAGIRAVLVNI